MCGLNAILRTDGAPAELSDLERMSEATRHRGPDAAAYSRLADGSVLLGHLRLSIIDLLGGDQPLFNEDGALCLVFNGEIYDHAQIRARLIEREHRFKTRTDAEVVLHLYEELGTRAFETLNGE